MSPRSARNKFEPAQAGDSARPLSPISWAVIPFSISSRGSRPRLYAFTRYRGFPGWTTSAQLLVVVLCGLALKLYYSAASANQLRWILAPTTSLVELVSGTTFKFESHAGYLSSDNTFLIAGSCAGVNFLITAFLMLSLRRLWRDRARSIGWTFIPVAASCAYLATVVANTVRISTALRLHRTSLDLAWLSGGQLHRLEGIFVYFGFLLFLFMVTERSAENAVGLLKQSLFPLLVYYATTLGMPLANGSYLQGADFWEQSLFVLLTPLVLIFPLALVRFWKDWRAAA